MPLECSVTQKWVILKILFIQEKNDIMLYLKKLGCLNSIILVTVSSLSSLIMMRITTWEEEGNEKAELVINCWGLLSSGGISNSVDCLCDDRVTKRFGQRCFVLAQICLWLMTVGNCLK